MITKRPCLHRLHIILTFCTSEKYCKNSGSVIVKERYDWQPLGVAATAQNTAGILSRSIDNVLTLMFAKYRGLLDIFMVKFLNEYISGCGSRGVLVTL